MGRGRLSTLTARASLASASGRPRGVTSRGMSRAATPVSAPTAMNRVSDGSLARRGVGTRPAAVYRGAGTRLGRASEVDASPAIRSVSASARVGRAPDVKAPPAINIVLVSARLGRASDVDDSLTTGSVSASTAHVKSSALVAEAWSVIPSKASLSIADTPASNSSSSAACALPFGAASCLLMPVRRPVSAALSIAVISASKIAPAAASKSVVSRSTAASLSAATIAAAPRDNASVAAASSGAFLARAIYNFASGGKILDIRDVASGDEGDSPCCDIVL